MLALASSTQGWIVLAGDARSMIKECQGENLQAGIDAVRLGGRGNGTTSAAPKMHLDLDVPSQGCRAAGQRHVLSPKPRRQGPIVHTHNRPACGVMASDTADGGPWCQRSISEKR